MVTLLNTRTGKMIVKNLSVRTTFLEKLMGYMMVTRPEINSGMLMLSTSRVHTVFMKFPLDLLYLDRSWKIIGARENVLPFKFPTSLPGCRHIVEIPHGGLDPQPEIKVGDRLSIVLKIHEGELRRMGEGETGRKSRHGEVRRGDTGKTLVIARSHASGVMTKQSGSPRSHRHPVARDDRDETLDN